MGAARTIGVLAGLCALLLLVSASRPQTEDPRLGASLRLSVEDVGELEISRADPLPVLADGDLRAGHLESGRLGVTNITDVPLGVGFILPSDELRARTLAAAQIRVRIMRGTDVVADTTVPGLLRGSRTVSVGPGTSQNFYFQAWIGGADPGLYAGQAVLGRLGFELVPLGETR